MADLVNTLNERLNETLALVPHHGTFLQKGRHRVYVVVTRLLGRFRVKRAGVKAKMIESGSFHFKKDKKILYS